MTAVKKQVVVEEDNDDRSNTSETENESSNDEDSDLNELNKSDTKTNAGWADSISKILKTNKKRGKKTFVLSKAKKLTDLQKSKVKEAGFEVESEGTFRKEVISESSDSETDQEDKKSSVRKKRKDILSIRTKPNILEKERERKLQKIATKGVVQLFNAVRNQQKEINTKLKEAGPLEVKRDKVLKNIDKKSFLDVLMGKKSELVDEHIDNTLKISKEKNENDNSTWHVLKDDFMMGAKMKDWDKEENNVNEEVENEIEMESD